MTTTHTPVSRVTADEVGARIDRGESILFVDSRSEEEWTESELKLRAGCTLEHKAA